MKSFLLLLTLVYAGLGHAMPVYNLQAESLVQQVAEGLNPNEPPEFLKAAWTSTFMLVFHREGGPTQVGSAVVVHREIHGDEQVLDLLTADHVLGAFCDQQRCQDESVYPNAAFDLSAGDWNPLAPALTSPNVVVLKRDAREDLALIQITTSVDIDAPAVELADEDILPGESAYAVGYPKIYLRKNKKGMVQPKVLRKRWSQGEVMGTRDYQVLAGEYVTTTVDALPGNSGGPLLKRLGTQARLVGVIGMTGSDPNTKFNYIDDPNGANQGVQGMAVGLDRVRAFLSEDGRIDLASSH